MASNNIHKRSYEDICSGSLPKKSKTEYVEAWDKFIQFIEREGKPEELDFLQYMDYLHHVKGYAGSTTWKVYSMNITLKYNKKFVLYYTTEFMG